MQIPLTVMKTIKRSGSLRTPSFFDHKSNIPHFYALGRVKRDTALRHPVSLSKKVNRTDPHPNFISQVTQVRSNSCFSCVPVHPQMSMKYPDQCLLFISSPCIKKLPSTFFPSSLTWKQASFHWKALSPFGILIFPAKTFLNLCSTKEEKVNESFVATGRF